MMGRKQAPGSFWGRFQRVLVCYQSQRQPWPFLLPKQGTELPACLSAATTDRCPWAMLPWVTANWKLVHRLCLSQLPLQQVWCARTHTYTHRVPRVPGHGTYFIKRHEASACICAQKMWVLDQAPLFTTNKSYRTVLTSVKLIFLTYMMISIL